MKNIRGTIEGGISVRKVEDFIADSEKRYFVLQGEIFSASPPEEIPDIVLKCAKKIQNKFFSLDAIELKSLLKLVRVRIFTESGSF